MGKSATGRWAEIWQTLSRRARRKVTAMHDALATTKQTRRALKVDAEVAVAEILTLQRRIREIDALQDKHHTAFMWLAAVARSALQLLKRAYVIPIYLILAWLFIRLARRFGDRVVANAFKDKTHHAHAQRAETLTEVVEAATKLVVYVLTFLLCLVSLGVDIGPLLGGAAIFGLAISFGSQSLVKDVVTGFFILIENQYAVGDKVQAAGEFGTVEAITLRRTVLRDLQGVVHNIPNGAISVVQNKSREWARVVSSLGVGYESDMGEVAAVINRVGDEMFADPAWSKKMKEPPRFVGITSFDDSAIAVRAVFKTKTFENVACEFEFNLRIKKAFDEAGISIPFPQTDVHIIPDSDESPAREEEGDKPEEPPARAEQTSSQVHARRVELDD